MKPTDEQIKALRKGDVVTVRAVINCEPDEDGDLQISFPYTGGTVYECVKSSEIMTIEPREIKVGDRVRDGRIDGEVKAICDGIAWVKLSPGKAVYAGYLTNISVSDLQVIP